MIARALLASPLGLVIGVSLGALGAGGSILAVPMLVHVAGVSPVDATTISLVVVTIAAAVGAIRHARAGRVRVKVGITFGAVGMGGSIVGSALARRLDGDLLMLGFAGLMLVAAWRIASACPGCTRVGEAQALAAPSTDALAAPSTLRALAILAVASAAGLLTGIFGVGGGFVVIPALVLVLGVPMPVAVGTSLVVVAINAAVALAARIADNAVPWAATVAFTLAAVIGVLSGSRLAERIDARLLQRSFAVLLVALALATGTAAALQLR